MAVLTESLLVIDDGRKFGSLCVNALSSLGYRNLIHTTFEDGIKARAGFPRLDAAVVHWNNELTAEVVGAIIRSAIDRCGCAGVLMVSSFCTAETVQQLRSAGVSAWVRVPFTRRDFAARLRYTIEGERRHGDLPVPVERRRGVPMPAFA